MEPGLPNLASVVLTTEIPDTTLLVIDVEAVPLTLTPAWNKDIHGVQERFVGRRNAIKCLQLSD